MLNLSSELKTYCTHSSTVAAFHLKGLPTLSFNVELVVTALIGYKHMCSCASNVIAPNHCLQFSSTGSLLMPLVSQASAHILLCNERGFNGGALLLASPKILIRCLLSCCACVRHCPSQAVHTYKQCLYHIWLLDSTGLNLVSQARSSQCLLEAGQIGPVDSWTSYCSALTISLQVEHCSQQSSLPCVLFCWGRLPHRLGQGVLCACLCWLDELMLPAYRASCACRPRAPAASLRA